jgi:FMN phosphatase YigB (HAD superfamily)
MFLAAAAELGLDLARSWLVGDILDDVAAGHRAGCRTVLLDNGHETLWQWSPERRPDFLASDLADAARIILAHSAHVPHAAHGAPRLETIA